MNIEKLNALSQTITRFLGPKSAVEGSGRFLGAATHSLWGHPELSQWTWRAQTIFPLEQALQNLGAEIISQVHLPLFVDVDASRTRYFPLHGLFLLITHPELNFTGPPHTPQQLAESLKGKLRTRVNSIPPEEDHLVVDLLNSGNAAATALWIAVLSNFADQQGLRKIELTKEPAMYNFGDQILTLRAFPTR